MTFNTEKEFENAFIALLTTKGWESEVIYNPTEEQLIQNWADILFNNNKEIDRLNNQALTDGEMAQIVEQITALKTPLALNGFINGKTVTIKRDNPNDTLHFGKEVSLKIYDRHEIAAGQSRYQIVSQPQFKRQSPLAHDRRGDVMLLINGMPVIHIELKKSGVHVSQAYNQIEKYSSESIFTGLFSLIQIFVAMNPEETLYFANPGQNGIFNKDYYFHWADFNNEPINEWGKVTVSLLSIPMAHQLIGFYTVADNGDGLLKVMRSYQYYAANSISDKVAKIDWKAKNIYGGYIWHTTGSGKTMTSFKSAQLIASSKDADKVIFLMDRIELGTQSLKEYRGFANDNETVQATENTIILINKLKSGSPQDTLIVTSIHKMSNIQEDGLNTKDIAKMNLKRIVFIVDEAHRSTFGDMLINIKDTFPNAIFFGFTGTPIQDENAKKDHTTATVFGDELHKYTIADGLRDKNVLGFDPDKILTYKDKDLRKEIALLKSKAKTEVEALANPQKAAIYQKYMDSNQIKMYGYQTDKGEYIKGIEDYVPTAQYEREEHQNIVVTDILDNFLRLSRNKKFHAIFATSSIKEAIEYYRLIKQKQPDLKTTALFDPNENNERPSKFKTDGIIEILSDYNNRFNQRFELATHGKFKKDISLRMAHKEYYKNIDPDKQLDLLIVVDQMLTGFDSKWVNTLYLDKKLENEGLIQAFSRTNRLFNQHEKPFGIIRYYRYPHTMEQNIQKALKLYSGDKPLALFVDKLEQNLIKMNEVYNEIFNLFECAKIQNFEKLPDDNSERAKFAKLFKQFCNHLEAAKIQTFVWEKLEYKFSKRVIKLNLDEATYLTLLQRYKELSKDTGGGQYNDVAFDIDGYLTEIDTDTIDFDYMNSRFDKYLKNLSSADKDEIKSELHKSFAILSQEDQKYANIFLHDIECGNIVLENSKTLKDYITQYKYTAEEKRIDKIVDALGVDKTLLKAMLNTGITKANINEYGRFNNLRESVDKNKAREYFNQRDNENLPVFKLNIAIDNILRDFILSNGDFS